MKEENKAQKKEWELLQAMENAALSEEDWRITSSLEDFINDTTLTTKPECPESMEDPFVLKAIEKF